MIRKQWQSDRDSEIGKCKVALSKLSEEYDNHVFVSCLLDMASNFMYKKMNNRLRQVNRVKS